MAVPHHTLPRRRLAIALLVLVAPRAAAQGHQSEIHEDLGLRWSRPNSFQPVPVSPDERGVLLRYLEKPATRGDGVYLDLAQAWVVELPRQGLPQQAVRDWLQARFPGEEGERPSMELGRLQPEDPTRHGLVCASAELEVRLGNRAVAEVGFGWTVESEDRRLLVLAVGTQAGGADDRARAHQADWEYAVHELRLLDRGTPDLEGRVRRFEKDELSDPPFRADLESRLVKGWRSEHAAHFVLIYATRNRPFIRNVADELETLRGVLTTDFPPRVLDERPALVRVFQDATQYFTYGAPRGTAGYYNPETRELVLFDNARRDGILGWDTEDTRSILYHEAFHQYIHDAVGDVEPHTWFDEGTGDYYGGAVLDKDGVKRVEPNPFRLAFLRELVKSPGGESRLLPWRKITQFTQPEFYRQDRASLCYAQSWSMIYFLRTSEVVAAHASWSDILGRYYRTLVERFESEAAGLPPVGHPARPSALRDARRAARTEAHRAAFDDVDLAALEEAWLGFLRDL